MIVTCKCGTDLTKSLYPTKKFDIDVYEPSLLDRDEAPDEYLPYDYEDDEWYNKKYKMKPGSFYISKWDGIKYCVARDDTKNLDIPIYREGLGCCDLAWIPVKCHTCKAEVGLATLDCHQDPPSIDFNDKKVIRKY